VCGDYDKHDDMNDLRGVEGRFVRIRGRKEGSFG
jgi:hypothetical protein